MSNAPNYAMGLVVQAIIFATTPCDISKIKFNFQATSDCCADVQSMQMRPLV
jgi:hypothetical protein